jgi:hypothetical protein
MRNFLFKTISHINYVIFSSITKIANGLVFVNGRIGWMILNVIDKKRMHHAETAVEQQGEMSELNVLFTIFQVRNNALKSGQWNEEHEDQLNFLGNVLANEHDWEVEQVQRYLYEVIETGPAVSKE